MRIYLVRILVRKINPETKRIQLRTKYDELGDHDLEVARNIVILPLRENFSNLASALSFDLRSTDYTEFI